FPVFGSLLDLPSFPTRRSSDLVFAALVLSRVHGVTRNGLVAAYAGRGEGLVEANARLGHVGAVAALMSVLPGVILLKLSGPGAALDLAAVTYAVSALLVLRLARPEHVVSQELV